jgi:hypothetical protein
MRIGLVVLALACGACSTQAPYGSDYRKLTSDLASRLETPFGVVLVVNPLTCMMDGRDADRINALADIPGLSVQVLFTGIPDGDSTALVRAAATLQLTVPVAEAGNLGSDLRELLEEAGSVGAVIRERKVRALVSGESMPRTIQILESAFKRTP